MTKTCKICNKKLLSRQRKFCSNKCKFSDLDYNKSRNHSLKNDLKYKLRCEICGWETYDVNNLSGAITKHEHFKFKRIENNDIKFHCPKCNWSTTDILNKSGQFTVHLNKCHSIQVRDFLKEFPHLKYLWKLKSKQFLREELLKFKDNRITCMICNNSFLKLSNTHLKQHGLTPTEYKQLYDVKKTTSKYVTKLQSSKVDRTLLSEKVKKTNQKKWGVNSYTQTKEGKQKVLQSLLRRNFKRYLNSTELSGIVEILFTENEYTGVVGKLYPFRCKKCNTTFKGSLENGKLPRCLNCYPYVWNGRSSAEKEIYDWLKTVYTGKIEYNVRNILSDGKEIDIYLPDKRVAIEYNGLYWHSELHGKHNVYHLEKTKKCQSKGIRLIHIFEDEWIHKQDIVKNRICNILRLNVSNRIYARHCIVREISTEEKNLFLMKTHLQGDDRSRIKLGLFFKDKLVSVMTFSKYKYKKLNDSTYELSRFSVGDVVIIGGFSKLLKHFIRTYSPDKIISFADIRWVDVNNNVYLANDFKLSNVSNPSYWYIINSNRVHRFVYRKKLLQNKLSIFDPGLTEWENMQLNGYDRIWDCGNLKYEFNVN